MVLFVPLYCYVFILLYKPRDFFSLDERYLFNLPVSYEIAWPIIILIMVAIGMMVLYISRLWMNFHARVRPLTYVQYILWVFCEILVMTIIYSITKSIVCDVNVFYIFQSVLLTVITTLMIPYLMCYVYFILQEKTHQLNDIRQKLYEDDLSQQRAYVQIFDDRGILRLSVKNENLVIIESADNYVKVWYIINDTPKQQMVRNTLKSIAEDLKDTHIMRCHRSYLVNMDLVKLLRREKEGIFVEFDIKGLPNIPLSKTYSESITQWLMNGAKSS